MFYRDVPKSDVVRRLAHDDVGGRRSAHVDRLPPEKTGGIKHRHSLLEIFNRISVNLSKLAIEVRLFLIKFKFKSAFSFLLTNTRLFSRRGYLAEDLMFSSQPILVAFIRLFINFFLFVSFVTLYFCSSLTILYFNVINNFRLPNVVTFQPNVCRCFR